MIRTRTTYTFKDENYTEIVWLSARKKFQIKNVITTFLRARDSNEKDNVNLICNGFNTNDIPTWIIRLTSQRGHRCIIIRLNWTDNKFLSVSRADHILAEAAKVHISRKPELRRENDQLFAEGFPGEQIALNNTAGWRIFLINKPCGLTFVTESRA